MLLLTLLGRSPSNGLFILSKRIIKIKKSEYLYVYNSKKTEAEVMFIGLSN
jgi:hypothetical protein